MLKIYTLGGLGLWYGEEALPLPPTVKARSLLAYLVVHRDRACLRERLAGLFWGDRPEHRARRSLATALWHVRRCLPDGYILSDPRTMQFDPQTNFWLDIEMFETQAAGQDVPSKKSAVAIYRGDFLEGFYDDWVINERYRLQALFFETLTQLMTSHEAKEEHQAALSAALRILSIDPLREDAHRVAMRAYCGLGQRNAALDQYRRCSDIVRQELDAEPMVETGELHQAILEGRFGVNRATVALPVSVAAVEPAPALGRNPLDAIATSSLVGREGELAFLRGCWQEAEAGHGGLALIRGEAGVGKTRLVEEFSSRLRWHGVRVLLGRCYEFERLLPYQPVAEALRAIPPALVATELKDFPSWAIGEVARLVPELTEHSRGLEAPAPLPADQDQTRLFQGLARFLTELSRNGPLVVVLEDLHWANQSTLGLVHYLVRHLTDHRVLTVGTFRQEAAERRHPLRELQGQLCREGMAKLLSLPRLPQADVETLVIEMSGVGEAALPLAARLYQETEGNPFFLIEIVKGLFEMGSIHLEGKAWKGNFTRLSEKEMPLPSSVNEAIQVRVRALGDEAQKVLRLGAVLGREFDFDLLNAIWDRSEEATLEALDALLRRRLIEEGRGAIGRDYAFTHHKIQEVVYAGIPGRHRAYTHARVGAIMESLDFPEREQSAGELAFHFQQAQLYDRALTEKAIAYLLQAGDWARGLYAHQEAVDYYQSALALLEEQDDYERAARTLMKLGLTYHTDFAFRRAHRAYEEGFAMWRRAGEINTDVPPPPAPHPLRVAWYKVGTLDPAMSGGIFSGAVIDQLFCGLVEQGPGMGILPDLSKHWEVLEGGSGYVFHLRDNVRWSDGVPITAGDFEYAWKRVLDPAIGSPCASLLFDVKGARALHRGEGTRSDVGIFTLDENTLLVELAEPTTYFPHLLTHHALYPVPRHVVETHGAAWAEVGNIVSNGPFRLESWQPDGSMAMACNSEYHGRFGGNLRRVELTLQLDPFSQLEKYEDGELDIFFLWETPPLDIDRARQRFAGDYLSAPWLVTLFLGFDVRRPPFDEPKVRQAFAMATDKERLADVVLNGLFSPGTGGLVPPGMPGHTERVGPAYDPDRARQLLAQAGFPDGRGFPDVVFLVPVGAVHEEVMGYLEAEWHKKLGVRVRGEIVDWATLLDRLDGERPHIFVTAWVADYPDPDNFLRVNDFRPYTGWRNGDYERLIDEASRLTVQGDRIGLYQEADRILVEEAVVVPLYYYRSHMLVKPWVTKYPTSATDQWLWKDVIIEPH